MAPRDAHAACLQGPVRRTLISAEFMTTREVSACTAGEPCPVTLNKSLSFSPDRKCSPHQIGALQSPPQKSDTCQRQLSGRLCCRTSQGLYCTNMWPESPAGADGGVFRGVVGNVSHSHLTTSHFIWGTPVNTTLLESRSRRVPRPFGCVSLSPRLRARSSGLPGSPRWFPPSQRKLQSNFQPTGFLSQKSSFFPTPVCLNFYPLGTSPGYLETPPGSHPICLFNPLDFLLLLLCFTAVSLNV